MANDHLLLFLRIQNMLGRVVNIESPEKKPTSSNKVKNNVRLRATRYLEGNQHN